MMKLIADTHTHTLSSGHAHSTVWENARSARQRGLQYLVISDHACAMAGAPREIYFEALPNVLPHQDQGVYLLSGCETNIVNLQGELDLSDGILRSLDFVIASMHVNVLPPSNRAAHTACWKAVCENPHVDVLGHLGDERFNFDHEDIVRKCKETDTIIEINSHSFAVRPGSKRNCADIARLCSRYEVPVVVSSDSHYAATVGEFSCAIDLLKSIDFPEKLVLNADAVRFAVYLEERVGRCFCSPEKNI